MYLLRWFKGLTQVVIGMYLIEIIQYRKDVKVLIVKKEKVEQNYIVKIAEWNYLLIKHNYV